MVSTGRLKIVSGVHRGYKWCLFMPFFAKDVYFCALGVPVAYILLIAIGRFLKRYTGIQLGLGFRIFCMVIAIYGAFTVANFQPIIGEIDVRRAMGALSVVFGASVLSAIIRHYVWDLYFERTRQMPLPKLLRQLSEVFVFIAACVLVLRTVYGRTDALTSFIAGSSAVAVIVGFAMQNLLGNVVAGVALEVARPFRPGDWLIFDEKLAEVMEVNWRSTKLRTNDDTWLDIPNSLLVSRTITNLSFPTRQHASRITVAVDYGTPPNVVKEVLIKAITPSVGVLRKPAPKAFLKDFADSAVIYEVKFWLDNENQHNDIFDSVRTNIWYALHRAHIRMPYPVRTVQLERTSAHAHVQDVPAATRAILRKKPFFQCLDDSESEQLLSQGRLQRFGHGEPIVVQGHEGHSMFVLLHGIARVLVESNGDSQQVAVLRDEDCFGEMSLLTGEPRMATVVAQGDCEVLEIKKETLGELMQRNPCVLERLSALLAERRMQTEGVIANTTSQAAAKEAKNAYTARFIQKVASFFEL